VSPQRSTDEEHLCRPMTPRVLIAGVPHAGVLVVT
jgi:hypothetical protein